MADGLRVQLLNETDVNLIALAMSWAVDTPFEPDPRARAAFVRYVGSL